MAAYIQMTHWSEILLQQSGIIVSPVFVVETLNDWWQRYPEHIVNQKRIYVQHSDQKAPGRSDDVTVAVVGEFEGVRTIAKERDSGSGESRLQVAELLLKDVRTGMRHFSLECRSTTLATMGWCALMGVQLLLSSAQPIKIFIFGDGELAEWVVRMLDAGAGKAIGQIAIHGLGESSGRLVERLRGLLGVDLVGVIDKSYLREADYVIDAHDEAKRPFNADEIGGRALILFYGHAKTDRACPDRDRVLSCVDDEASAFRLSYNFKKQRYAAEGMCKVTQVFMNPSLRAQVDERDGRVTIRATDTACLDVIIAVRIYELLLSKVLSWRIFDQLFDANIRNIESNK